MAKDFEEVTFEKRELLTRAEAAKFLGVQEHTLATWASSKRYPLNYIRVGRRAMYRRSHLEQFLESRTVQM